jgi:hypothetical protein
MALPRQPEPATAGPGRKLVLLLGMHRSGTSVAAQAFARAGLPLGERLALEPVPDNLAGYWEDEDIVRIHSALLVARFGERQDFGIHGLEEAVGTGSPPPPSVEQAREQLLSVLFARLAGSSAFGFKDPRTARFLPLWNEIAHEIGADLMPVLLLRAPAAVAASLAARDGIRADVGELMWLRSVVDVVRHVGERLTGVLSYENWFERPELNRRIVSRTLAAAGLAETAGWRSPAVEEERHESATEPMLPLADAVHRLLSACGEAPPDAAMRQEILDRVDHVLDAFGGWSAFGEATARLRRSPHGDTLVLGLPFSDGDGEASASRFDPGVVALVNGNAGCRRLRGGFVLRANPSRSSPAELWFRAFRAPAAATLKGQLVARGARASVRLGIARSDRAGEVSESAFELDAGGRAPIDVALPGGAYLDIRLSVTAPPSGDAVEPVEVPVQGLRAKLPEC